MLNTRRLFGVSESEHFAISYLDTKMYQDEVCVWRYFVREAIQQIRATRESLSVTRDIHKRQRLKIMLRKHEKDVALTWGIYREVQATARDVHSSYLESCRTQASTAKTRPLSENIT